MTSRDFCYWLQGYLEVQQPTAIDENKVVMIQKHLNLVFKHEIDPSMGNGEHQAELNAIHNKPTLEELGKEHGFQVTDAKWGASPGQEYVLSPMYGWYDPKHGIPRC